MRGAMLITGGAGFVGANLAHALLGAGVPVVIFDNFSRAGVRHNAAWLGACRGVRLKVVRGDVRDVQALQSALDEAERLGDGAPVAGVFHFAAQVAVTSSLTDPGHDFSVNVGGTLNLLELVRNLPAPPPLIFTSTNKVYGDLAGVRTVRVGSRYAPDEAGPAAHGVDEAQPLDFRSPYGCSKGAADQYVLEYARSFGVPAAVFRMSCIYGPRQFGTEDQGWIAHFLIRALAGQPITLFGDGAQVRDALFVDDLVAALLTANRGLAAGQPDFVGQAFNIGGGPGCALSLIDLLAWVEDLLGAPPSVRYAPWRVGDQRWYVSDCRKFGAASGWAPRVEVREGIARLCTWLRCLGVDGLGYEDRAGVQGVDGSAVMPGAFECADEVSGRHGDPLAGIAALGATSAGDRADLGVR